MTAFSPIAFDPEAIRSHVEMLHDLAKGCDGIIPLCIFGENPDNGRKTTIVQHFRVGDVEGMTKAALAYEALPDANLYSPLAVMRRDLPRGDKGKERDVIAVLGAVIDDDADAGRSAHPPIAPGYVLQTSSVPTANTQGFIFFDRALTVTDAKPLLEALSRASGGDSGTKDACHVWRIPGTANWPNVKKVTERGRPRQPQPVTVLRPWDGTLTNVETLREALAGYAGSSRANDEAHDADGGRCDVAAIMARLGAGLRKLIMAPAIPGEDRSKTIASVITSMIRAGLNDADIRGVIEAHPQGIGAKFVGRGDLGIEIKRLRTKFDKPATGAVSLVRAADVDQEHVRWIWEGRIAAGKLSLIGGDPGVGKSQVVLAMIARITTGRPWPDGGIAPLGNCIILSAEDAASDTICPRLEAAGADLSRVHIVQAVCEQGGRKRSFNLQSDLDSLSMGIETVGGATLVMIDPITAYMGETDSHKTADVRAVLEAVDRFSAAKGIAVVAITHPPKAAQAKAINAFTGSLAYVAAARLAFVAVEEAEDSDPTGRVLLLPVKNNIGRKAEGIAYRIEPAVTGRGIATCRVAWDSAPVTMTATEAVSGSTGRGKSAQQEAEDWLSEYLADQPMPAKTVIEAAEGQFIAERTLRRAAKALGVITEKSGFGGGWTWRLPSIEWRKAS